MIDKEDQSSDVWSEGFPSYPHPGPRPHGATASSTLLSGVADLQDSRWIVGFAALGPLVPAAAQGYAEH